MTFGVTIATYCRSKFPTRPFLVRALQSIKDQTNTNWKIYLIGDRYEKKEEFEEIVKLIPQEKIYSINLPIAKERDEGMKGLALWNCGGVNAMNTALDKQREEKIDITCHLDDDDYWSVDHLETLADAYAKFPEAVFIYTRAAHMKTSHLPIEAPDLFYNNVFPTPCCMVHSSASWRLDKIPFNYTSRSDVPSDAAMWATVTQYCVGNQYKTLYVPKVTTHHEQQQQGDIF